MHKSAKFRFPGWSVFMVAIGLGCGLAAAQQPRPNLPPFTGGSIPFTAGVTNGHVTLSWPVMPGKWELTEQKRTITGQWDPVPTEQYKTNGMSVSVTLRLPKERAYFRVHRVLGFRVPKLPNLPPVPPPPTNLPPKFKPHQ